MSIPKKVQFVVKTSKLCNLRCRYCYEYAELGNREAITLEQLHQMFQNIASYYQKFDFPVDIEFVWHGGEPLLLPPDYYWNAFELQRQTFGAAKNLTVTNVVQTNLTVLNAERIKLLRDGFDSVGVSIDLFGGLRVNSKGIDSQDRVLANIDRLQAENISIGCITVLTKLNLPYLKEIYNFYRTLNLPFRLLPLFKGAFLGQHQGFEITANDTLEAFRALVDLWLEDEQLVNVMPITNYIQRVIQNSDNDTTYFYDKSQWESVYLVNTTGDIYSHADAYNIELSHGNIFTTPMSEIVAGKLHQKVIENAEQRIAATCSNCLFFGKQCSGFPIAEGNLEYNEVDSQGAIRCIVDKGILKHIEYRLLEAGIISNLGNTNIEKLNIPHPVPSLACV